VGDLSEADLKAIEMRVDQATPSPWETFQGEDFHDPEDYDGMYPRWRGVLAPGRAIDPAIVERCGGEGYSDSILNADFIAHARTDVPALVAEVRRLRALTGDPGTAEAGVCPRCGHCFTCGRPYPQGWAHGGGPYQPHPFAFHDCLPAVPS
jgi:hypothetical protein